MNFSCEKTWNIFSEGRTKGVFQLETNLGRSWSKKSSPKSIEELAALISIIRPGTLEAVIDGEAMTKIYVECKNNGREPKYLHPSLEEILKDTYGVLVYQEQSMQIARKLAGFTPSEADDLRKAIGKKKADLMAELKVKFIDGCEVVGLVSREAAEEIFGWVEKSSRYAFNKSHAVSYAITAYQMANKKAHTPKIFFKELLNFACEKQKPQEEIYELVSDARLYDINIKLPTIKRFSKDFEIRQDGNIYFGLCHVKGLTGVNGENVIKAINSVESDLGKPASDLSWLEILIYLSPKCQSSVFKSLCSLGFFSTDTTKISRSAAIFEFMIFNQLKEKTELKWVTDNYPSKRWKDLKSCLIDLQPTKKNGGGTSTASRSSAIMDEITLMSNPPFSLEDSPSWIINEETKLLGCPISLANVDAVDSQAANTTCKDIINGKKGEGICVVANLKRVQNVKVKKGKTAGQLMSFLTIEDETCAIDSVILFPKEREKLSHMLHIGANLLFCGKVDGDDSSFIVENIHDL